ncbi:EGF domain-specific O-linked N-acetylglucosamine transferase [Aphelenchoides besseyi]|nr:EGF domain-specific O-linked N-acetylglucosamine transferase [Aphelenchoides besseyi]
MTFKIEVVFLFLFSCANAGRLFWKNLELESSLLDYSVLTNGTLRSKCLQDPNCPIKTSNGTSTRCWGYEPSCRFEDSYSADLLKCYGKSDWPGVEDKPSHKKLFWTQGDFGLLKQQVDTLRPICESNDLANSFLECSAHLRWCRGRNLVFDFKNLRAKTSRRYRDDVIGAGQVGGNCDSHFDSKLLANRTDELSYLQSWGYELRHYESSEKFRVDDSNCDVIFEKPTYIIKLDASINMYHHFCDFINLFATQFINESFSRDVDIFWWDTSPDGYVDETFGATWRAFSSTTPKELIKYDGKRVCFRDAVFSLLARQRMGLYYNMPLVDGCVGSGLFRAFSRHLLHRLNVAQVGPLRDKVRITLLERKTRYRRIVNVEELKNVLRNLPNVKFISVNYGSEIPFEAQLYLTHNTDVFIGMHGSGLTHLLALPDWAVLFELYNCGDVDCYRDLSRLRGLNYLTWSKSNAIRPDVPGRHPTSGTPHEKFANYEFDVEEFKRLCNLAVEMVRRHPIFVQHQRQLRRSAKAEL